jgi:hypothetical protein
MPDWIRLVLVDSFSGQQEKLVREALIDLLSSVYQGQEFDLIFSRKSDMLLKSNIQKLFKALKRISPAESLLQDGIFIDFITERRNEKISIALPEIVRKLLADVAKSKSAIHPKNPTVNQISRPVLWDYFRRLWLVFFGRRNLAEPYVFSSHEVISPAFIFHVSYLLQGIYLNLHPTLYAVCIFADGSRKRFDEGGLIIPFPSGNCTLHYVDKTDRQSESLKITENTLDAARIALTVKITYRVLDPIKIFDIQKPVETLFAQVQADLKEYIRTRLYEDLIGNDDNQVIDSGLVAKYIKQQHGARYPMSQVFTIGDVVVQEKEWDPVFFEKRKSYQSQVVDSESKMKTQELNKKIASQEAEMQKIQYKYKAKLEQQKDTPDLKQVYYDLTYRQEILSRLFGFIRNTDSFHLIGAPRMGKTRLLDFLMRNSVQEFYLGDDYEKTWLVRVDINRIPVASDWEFYFFELLLSSMVLCCISRNNVNEEIMKDLIALDSDVMKSQNLLFASRFFEWETSKLCQKYDIKLCFLFDEFDETYRKMPPEVFAHLRSVRDANKNHLLYGMFLREPPKTLRKSNDNKSFYELLSHNLIGIGPYTRTDIMNVIENLGKDWGIKLTPEKREKIGLASGGHPGIVKALLSLIRDPLVAKKIEDQDWLAWFSKQETIIEECENIWNGLDKEEKLTLLAPFQGGSISSSIAQLLMIKGIIQKSDNGGRVFSPIFEQYLKSGLAKVE